ncbi:MAG: MATE family efflux transporter [Bryobacteraceae bacterium]
MSVTSPASARRAEIRAMTRLAAPLVLAEVGWMMMGVVDTMVVGRVSADAIGAVSLGTNIFYTIAIFASGLLLGLDTMIAQSFGAGDLDDCRRSLIQSIWLALFLMAPVMLAAAFCIPLLGHFGIDPALLRDADPYMRALDWSAPPLLLFFALRRYLQGVNVVRPIMITLIAANLVNLAANWVLVFGNLGAPRLGAEGAGWSTCISRLFMMAALGIVVVRQDRQLFRVSWRPNFSRIRKLLALGLPAAGQIGLELAVFATATVLIGKLGANALAGHQIALTTVSMTYMMPLGISSAAAVRVGQAIGRGDPAGAARSGWTALAFGGTVMGCAAIALLAIPGLIARLFTPEAQIIAAGAALLRVAAFFQLFDGFQVVATGALRGAGDTRTPMFCHFAGYWVIGLPLGALLCFHFSLGATGLWMGLSSGLILIGIVLLGFWKRAVGRL